MPPNFYWLRNMKKQRSKDGKFAKGNTEGNRFKKAPQGLDELKSNGKIETSIKRNILETLRTNIDNTNLVSEIVLGVAEEVAQGNYKNGIELLKIAKEPETQNINLNGGVEIQKVFIDAETKKKTKEHIQDFIDGK